MKAYRALSLSGDRVLASCQIVEKPSLGSGKRKQCASISIFYTIQKTGQLMYLLSQEFTDMSLHPGSQSPVHQQPLKCSVTWRNI